MEVGEHNSYRFYGKSWEVSSSTAHEWIKEFNEALEIFDAARELKRKVHYQEANKKSDVSLCLESNRINLTDETERIEHSHKPMLSNCLENNRTNLTDETERSFNYINNKKENVFLNNDFYRFISEIKMVIKNVGNVEDIYESYLKVKDLIDLPTLSKIYREYSNETKTERKVGLSKFLSDLMYLSYCKPYIVVENDGLFVTGTYDKDKEILITKDKNYGLTLSRYSELNADNRIKIIKYVA
ncbi:hypothetical protein [Aliarcobacter butzleri]